MGNRERFYRIWHWIDVAVFAIIMISCLFYDITKT